ncbi:unnamed protein product [Thlaspi arvense]|uniref:Pentatricopeptide repeat-containing protein n=1 Tax=Thlaspi arvense TaxID=13288 RepID=A0AAU9RK10_THLAR|nr:unnamed protein product [Thlaspi arvense]
MRSKGLKPDAFTYLIFIHAACDANDLHSAFRVLDRTRRYNLVPNVYTYNRIIKELCKNDKVENAYLLLDEMTKRGVRSDIWSYNAILAFHCNRNEELSNVFRGDRRSPHARFMSEEESSDEFDEQASCYA